MAVHEDSSAHKNKSSDGLDEISAFNVENMQNNTRIINYSRTFMSIIGGVIAGILGFTGLTGFVFYFIVMAITTVGLAAKTGFAVHSYFDSWNRIVFDGILSGLLYQTPFISCSMHILKYCKPVENQFMNFCFPFKNACYLLQGLVELSCMLTVI
ncbi:er membrane protein complex subunit 6 [Phtheirospermum japonicum]|uniref:ER membrane protein complex subunit 6 n=1 Tax=Phtheirospermum japonicum TaxID=374723 RepID=A0A830CRJ8_9LAMI|nr:er membrane protein complex subunit 6 [Phtheirospermum japonicum]